jgi:hypothetical protein
MSDEDLLKEASGSIKPSQSFGEWATTPKVTPEQIRNTPVMGQVASAIPIAQMLAGVPRSAPISMENFAQEGSQDVSFRTSPLGAATTAIEAIGGLKAFNKLPQLMGRGYVLKNAEQAKAALDTTRESLGKTKGAVIEQFGDKVVSNFKPTFAQKTIKLLRNPLYEIEFTEAGAIKPTVKNLDRVLQALGDIQTGQGFKEATKKIQSSVSQSYKDVASAMRTAYPEIAPSIEQFHRFMGKYNLVNKSLTSKGEVVASKLKGLHGKDFEEATFRAWKELGKNIPEIKQVIKNIGKYTGRRATLDMAGGLAKKALPWAVGTGTAAGAFQAWKLFQE